MRSHVRLGRVESDVLGVGVRRRDGLQSRHFKLERIKGDDLVRVWVTSFNADVSRWNIGNARGGRVLRERRTDELHKDPHLRTLARYNESNNFAGRYASWSDLDDVSCSLFRTLSYDASIACRFGSADCRCDSLDIPAALRFCSSECGTIPASSLAQCASHLGGTLDFAAPNKTVVGTLGAALGSLGVLRLIVGGDNDG